MDPVALAVWYLDDGTKKDYNVENELLPSCLKTNFNQSTQIEKWKPLAVGKADSDAAFSTNLWFLVRQQVFELPDIQVVDL